MRDPTDTSSDPSAKCSPDRRSPDPFVDDDGLDRELTAQPIRHIPMLESVGCKDDEAAASLRVGFHRDRRASLAARSRGRTSS
jgi:hypothetical protein